MASNPYVNKVVYNGDTLIDLTGDTVAADKMLEGYTAHDASGKIITGALVPDETVVEALTVTPTTSQQIFQPSAGIDGYTPVTVEPIPSNYGLITYDGSTITVS